MDDDQMWLELQDSDPTDSASADNSSRPSAPPMSSPSDSNLDEDLLDPIAWEAKFRRVEAAAVMDSAFHLLADRQETKDSRALPLLNQTKPRILFPGQGFPGYWSRDAEMWSPLRLEQTEYADFADMATLWRMYTGSNPRKGESLNPYVVDDLVIRSVLQLHRDLLESRNLLVRVCCNVRKCCQSGISQGYISVIVATNSRPGVASLQSVNVDQIYKLTRLVDSLLYALHWALSKNEVFPKVEQGTRGDVQAFMSQIETIGDTFEAKVLALSSRVGLQAIVDICRVIGHVLDMAVLTYCGAHLKALDETYLDRHIESFEIHYPVLFEWPQPRSMAVVMHRRSLSCLDEFLHERRVWVFHYDSLDNEPSASSDSKLYLSTSIEAFADLWGPVWEVLSPGEPDNTILRYNVGSGAIISWPKSSQTEPEALLDEALCQWSFSADDIASSKAIILSLHPRLLIGGARTATMSTNPKCPSTTDSILGALRHQNRLKPWGTSAPQKYKASEIITLQVGYSAVQVGFQAQYKCRPGVTLKERLIESWKNGPDLRNPKVLEMFIGVEVSLCTFNTRRRRLTNILGSKTMRDHLRNRVFTWSDPQCEKAYYSALSCNDPQALSRLYREHEYWKKDIGTAVAFCLEELQDSGLQENGDLAVFYTSESRVQHQDSLVAVTKKEHSWVGMLKDSEYVVTVAIATEECLEFSIPRGQQCRARGLDGDQFSILETKLDVYADSQTARTSRHSRGDKIPLGPAGSLEVMVRVHNGHIIAKWRKRSLTDAMKQPIREKFSAGTPSKLCQEHMVDESTKEHEELAPPKLLTVFVISKHPSNLPSFEDVRAAYIRPHIMVAVGSSSCGITDLLRETPQDIPSSAFSYGDVLKGKTRRERAV